MRQTEDVKAQIDFIIKEQIEIILARRRACERIFSHETWDKYTAEYNRLEGDLKKLIGPSTPSSPVKSISPSSVSEGAPTQEETVAAPELS